mgnify:CR=1 FL=1
MKTFINLKMMKEKNACSGATRKIGALAGNSDVTLMQALDATDMQDAFWWLRANDLTPDQERDLRLLACDYAEHVLHIFEDKNSNDYRPRRAIDTARRHALGQATKEELVDAAAGAARAAADGAYGAYDDAAAAGAYDAAYAAVRAAGAATGAAAADADAAADAAAGADVAVADAAERKYQTEKLRELLVEWCAL